MLAGIERLARPAHQEEDEEMSTKRWWWDLSYNELTKGQAFRLGIVIGALVSLGIGGCLGVWSVTP